MNGKGDRNRTTKHRAYWANYDRIFAKPAPVLAAAPASEPDPEPPRTPAPDFVDAAIRRLGITPKDLAK